MNVALLHNVARAKLPQTYEGAKRALAECVKLDECKHWKDKAAALASYAKQANDDELHTFATRIKARAIRRCGELLQQIEPATGAHLKREVTLPLSRTQAATDAGLSEHQRKTALQVANVPADLFEHQVESDEPPTIEQLAAQGKQPTLGPDHLGLRTPLEFQAATKLIGIFYDLAKHALPMDIAAAVRGLTGHERPDIRKGIQSTREWLTKIEAELRDGDEHQSVDD